MMKILKRKEKFKRLSKKIYSLKNRKKMKSKRKKMKKKNNYF
jgi:hypothetical protein